MHRVEILITEKNPGIVFIILQTIAARDVQRGPKFLQRSVKSIPFGAPGQFNSSPQ